MVAISDLEGAIVESREALMVSHVGNSTPTLRMAHFLKPTTNISSSASSSSSSSTTKAEVVKHHPLLFPSSSPLSCNGKKKKWPLEVSFMSWPHNPPNPNWKSWVQNLAPSHETLWKQAGIYEAIMSSTHGFREDRRLIMEMAEKWCPETNTFVFPWGEATVTLEDALILSGFSVSGDPFFACSEEIEEKLERVAGRIRRRTTSDEEFQDEWMSHFMTSRRREMMMEHQAFLSLWLGRYVLNDSQGTTMKSSVYSVAAHLARGKPVALAPVVLANIYRDLSLLKATIVSASKMEATTSEPDEVMAVNLWSLLHLVQLWAWERFPKLRPVPNSIQTGDPRSAMWAGLSSRRVRDMKLALDSAGDTFRWRPYAVSINGWKCPEYLYREKEEWLDSTTGGCNNDDHSLLSYGLCLRVSELVGQGCTELYLPHRVAMQFGMDQDLPDIVVPSNECHEIVWLAYARPLSGDVYVPSRLFEPDVTVEYLKWWREPMFSSLEDMPGGFARRRRTASKRKRLASLYSQQGRKEANEGIADPVGNDDYDDDDDDLPIAVAMKKFALRKESSLSAGFATERAWVSPAKGLPSIPPVKQAPVITSLSITAPSEENSMAENPAIPLEHSSSIDNNNNVGGESSGGDKGKGILKASLMDEILQLEKALEELRARTYKNIKIEKD